MAQNHNSPSETNRPCIDLNAIWPTHDEELTTSNDSHDSHDSQPQGSCFKPNDKYIFGLLLPERLIDGEKSEKLRKLYDEGDLREENIYSCGRSPEEIFGGSKKAPGEDIYFFTKLEKTSGSLKRKCREIPGKGTWSCKGKTINITSRGVKVGTRRAFRFLDNQRRMLAYSWLMHEYEADKDYLVREFGPRIIDINKIEDIAFCRAYKRPAKKIKITDGRLKINKKQIKITDAKAVDSKDDNNNNNNRLRMIDHRAIPVPYEEDDEKIGDGKCGNKRRRTMGGSPPPTSEPPFMYKFMEEKGCK